MVSRRLDLGRLVQALEMKTKKLNLAWLETRYGIWKDFFKTGKFLSMVGGYNFK